ncbi:hypothetical protein [Parachitinimonas caeni]|uniref:DUF2897 family protein n=1 Tax=Parachitinimonas caeni TaxID=3031301 RepID=A0ABT7DUY0_9NEIS|nr:hypothetical protein [Parachitinimonas caeni]MDK2123624.1 hypothetical protein [Parachitinimonas caeni]
MKLSLVFAAIGFMVLMMFVMKFLQQYRAKQQMETPVKVQLNMQAPAAATEPAPAAPPSPVAGRKEAK